MKKVIPLLFVFFLFSFHSSFAQRKGKKSKNTFHASVLLGANLAQVDGDGSTGFKKLGAYGGLRGTVFLSRREQINFELLFSQKGSIIDRSNNFFNNQTTEYIRFNYMEIPVFVKWYLKKDYEGIYIETGLTFARLIGSTVKENEGVDPNQEIIFSGAINSFKKNEINLLGGLGWDFKEHYSIGLRYTYALTPVYKNGDYELPEHITSAPDPIFQLRNYFITILGAYHF